MPNGNVAKLGGGKAVQHPGQVHEYLLCHECEARMKWGEDYVHGVCYQDDYITAPFMDLVGEVAFEHEGLTMCLPGELDTTRLAYFGLSVIWRASVSTVVPECKIASEHEESLRRYLLHETPQPADVTCFVKFHDLPREGTGIGSMFTMPTSTGSDVSAFLLFGLAYKIEFGEPGQILRPLCIANSPQHWVGLGAQQDVVDWLGDWLLEQRPVGALAALAKS